MQVRILSTAQDKERENKTPTNQNTFGFFADIYSNIENRRKKKMGNNIVNRAAVAENILSEVSKLYLSNRDRILKEVIEEQTLVAKRFSLQYNEGDIEETVGDVLNKLDVALFSNIYDEHKNAKFAKKVV